MAELSLVYNHGVLLPANDSTAERVVRYKRGDLLVGEFRKVRNPKFHRKFFALLDTGFDAWEPEAIESTWGEPQKNRELFREQVTILAGYYETSIGLDGKVRLVAKSISFASMDDVEFEELYSSCANVLLQKVLTGYTQDDLDQQVERILGFV